MKLNSNTTIRPLIPPVYLTTSFTFDNLKQAQEIFSFKQRNFVYSRGGNPTVNLLERKLADLEKAGGGVCFSSGMGAISTTLMSLLSQGDTLLLSDMLYGAIHGLAKLLGRKYGIKVRCIDLTDIRELEETLKQDKSIKVIFFETPCNPTLKAIDIHTVCRIAHRHGDVKVIIDNTIATPFTQKPLTLGADIVVHSLSKQLNGHSDVLGGVAISNDTAYIDSLKFMYLCHFGATMDAACAHVILRGLQTAKIRIEAAENSAQEVAEYLSCHKKIKRVMYCGLNSYEYKDIAQKQMSGNGTIISFHLKDSRYSTISKFLSHLNTFKLSVSFGGVESQIEYPLHMTHRDYLEHHDTKAENGLHGLLRISVGLNDPEILIQDLKEALKSI
jgi:methionine-gamma-lyase